MKRIDTHSHPNISKHYAFDPQALVRMVARGQRVGLDALAVTEHLHARTYWRVYDHIERTYPRVGGLYRAGDLSLITGGEVNIREGAHVIVLGDLDEIRRLDRAFPDRLSRGYEPALREFLDVTDDFDLLRIGAHMFRRSKELGKFPASDLRRLHALEVNGKDYGLETMLLAQARALDLPIVAGSDAHHWLQIGVRHTLIHVEELTIHSIMKGVKEGLTGFGVAPYTPLRVRAAKSLKTITKLLRKCYGGMQWQTAVSAAPGA